MNPTQVTRRRFVGHCLAASAVAGLLRAPAEAAGESRARSRATRPIRLGGPGFAKADDPEEMAVAHRKLGYAAAYCPNVPLSDSARIREIADAFAKHNVVIAEVGRWVNLLDTDSDKRRKNLQTVTEGLALGEAVGARCCVDIAGSFNPTVWYGPHPDNLSARFFDAAVENARKIIDAVKPKRTSFTYEMIGWAIPNSADSYLKLLRAVDRKAFAVHLDPCNVINSPEKFYRNGDVIGECFQKLGRWIVSCHAKDLTWDVEMNVHFREVGPGKGAIDYATYLRRLAALPQSPPLMLEHLSKAEEYDEARRHLFELGRTLGLEFA